MTQKTKNHGWVITSWMLAVWFKELIICMYNILCVHQMVKGFSSFLFTPFCTEQIAELVVKKLQKTIMCE